MAAQYRADLVGSLLPSHALLAARAGHRTGDLSLAQLRAAEDAAIIAALQLQHDAGLPIATDGELRRETLFSVVSDAVDGFVSPPLPRGGMLHDALDLAEPPDKVIGAPLRRLFRLARLEAAFLRQHTTGPIKVTLPSPVAVMHALYRPGISERAYPNPEAVLDDLVPIVRDELLALADDGVAYLQLDEGFLGFMGEGWRGRLRLLGQDPKGALERAIAAENACYDALPRERLTLAIHLCRRNARGPWGGVAGYEELAEQLFNELHVDRFLLEFDCERAGSFSPLRFMPREKTAVLGLVSSRQSWLETDDNLLSRIDEASRYLSLEQLAISTQCGFARAAARGMLSEADQQTKLRLVAQTARTVWGQEAVTVPASSTISAGSGGA